MGSRTTFPVIGHAIAAVALAGMVCYSLLRWDDMPAQVVTRQAAGRHGASVVPRGVSAVTMPVALLLCTLLLMLMPLWNRLVGATPLRPGLGRHESTTVWSTILATLSALLLALHIGIVDMCTGRGPQLPQLASYGMAAILGGLAVICSVQPVRARRVITVITAALVLGGVLVAALAYALPLAAMIVGTAVMLGSIIALAVPRFRDGMPG
ncbi:hypothetical protein [uncultured Propionibacterium sp.]|uniref:hypothetical protein n=1 Tax=uncultured Propionibacterium sp. TaxID=218066 RepID=UPI0029307B29|nr:hypothetical protein [uncultured Propionibacterium sp.]